MCLGDVTIHSCEARHGGLFTMVAQNTAGKAQREVNLSVHAEGEWPLDDVGVAERDLLVPVPVAEFGSYVSGLHSNNNKGFKEQYKVS